MTGDKKASGCLWFGLGCCGCPVLAAILLVAVAGGLLVGVRFTGPFDEAVDRARRDPGLVAELGEPISAGLGVSASYSRVAGTGTVLKLRIPVTGPQGEALLSADAVRDHGRWRFLSLEAELADGRTLDLLAEPEPI